MNTTIEFCIFELVQVLNSNWRFWFLGSNLPEKDISQWTSVLHIRISLVAKFQFKLNFEFWSQICPKTGILCQNRKSEDHYWVLHRRISLDTKFQLKLIILIFWIKFSQKALSRSKTEKVNTTIEFCIIESVQAPNFSLNWTLWFFGSNLFKRLFPV